MIDFHVHLLPGVDDGSRNTKMSAVMLKESLRQDIEISVATPHFYFEESTEKIIAKRNKAYNKLVKYFDKKKMIVAGILVLCATNASEIAALAALFMIHVYNGERGKGSKLLFYAFYPAHLAVLAVFGVLIGLIKLRFNF